MQPCNRLAVDVAPVAQRVAAVPAFLDEPEAAVQREGALVVFSLYGSLFFGAAAKVDQLVEAVESAPPEPQVVLDALQLVHLDTSGLEALRQLHKVILLRGGTLRIANVQEQPRQVMAQAGFEEELARHVASEEVAA